MAFYSKIKGNHYLQVAMFRCIMSGSLLSQLIRRVRNWRQVHGVSAVWASEASARRAWASAGRSCRGCWTPGCRGSCAGRPSPAGRSSVAVSTGIPFCSPRSSSPFSFGWFLFSFVGVSWFSANLAKKGSFLAGR